MCRACEFCAEYVESFPDELTHEEVVHFICTILNIYGSSWDGDDKRAVLSLIAQYLYKFNREPTSYTH